MGYVIYFLITIAILVFVHEFGHFIAAKISKMRVDVFAIGFGKRLFGWNKLTGFTFGDLADDFDGEGNTDYRICLLPLGGYVKIAGMVDESFDVKFADQEPRPYEFRAKPTGLKLFVITAGVLMNLLLAYFIFAGANYFQQRVLYKTTTIGYVVPNSAAEKAGLRQFDKVLSVNGKKAAYFDEDVLPPIIIENMSSDVTVNIERDNGQKTINIPRKTFSSEANKFEATLLPGGWKVFVDSVIKGSPAANAGLKGGDQFLKMNNEIVANRVQPTLIISSNSGKTMPVSVLRGQDTVSLSVTPGKDGKIGVMLKSEFTGHVDYRSLSLTESLWNGVLDIGRFTKLTFTMLSNVIRGRVEFSSAFGGPVKIAQYAAKTADSGFLTFIVFLATLSLSLAILNILPFPVLDGGHFVIILIEGIIKREIPVKVKVAIQNAGFVILLLFMAFVIYNDLISL